MNIESGAALPMGAADALIDWFRAAGRQLPWRGEVDPYLVWVSEVMLQQTQVSVVVPRYERWRRRFPTLASLARADIQDVLKEWEGLGYYSRARNLHQGARHIVDNAGGIVPSTGEQLLEVPGIGPYTAAAVASIAFNAPVGAVDGNVARVIARLLRIAVPKGSPAFQRQVKRVVEANFGPHEPRWMNQAWMELGALICARRPACSRCPLLPFCAAAAAGDTGAFPVRRPARPPRERTGMVFVIERGGAVLMVQRPFTGLLGGLWELPNVMSDEELPEAFITANRLSDIRATGLTARHQYSHFSVEFAIVRASLAGEWQHPFWPRHRWASGAQLTDLPRPQVHIKALAALGLLLA